MVEARNPDWPTERVAGLERSAPGWDTEIDRLLRLGPTGEPNAPVPSSLLLDVIAWLERETPGPSGFTWADQVRSGAALRRHLRQIQDAMARESRRPPPGANGYGQALGRTEPASAADFARLETDENGRWIPRSFDDD